MRKSFIAIIASVAAIAAVSCQKEQVTAPQTQRIFSFAFDRDATKTTVDPDGVTPSWAVGDVIRVMDEKGYEDITLTAEIISSMVGEVISIPVSLTSEYLYAVYPASCTAMEKCSTDELIINIPPIQDGTFGSANICVAMNDEDNLFLFHNAASIVKVSQSSATGLLGYKLEADKSIAGSLHVFINGYGEIDGTLLDGESSSVTAVGTEAKADYYLAVAPVTETGEVKLTYLKSDSYASVNKSSKQFKISTIYNLGNIEDMGLSFASGRGVLNGHEYVEIAGLKWATENVTLTDSGRKVWCKSSHYTGDFFQWGSTSLLYDSFKIQDIPADDNPSAFSFTGTRTFWAAAKDLSSSTYDENGKIVPGCDVVRQEWGSTWRLPKGGDGCEFLKLYQETYWVRDEETLGIYIFAADASHPAGTVTDNTGAYYKFEGSGLNKKDALLYFPASGWGKTNAISSAGKECRLLMDNYDSSKKKIGRLYITNNTVNEVRFKTQDWFYGSNIRPVSD